MYSNSAVLLSFLLVVDFASANPVIAPKRGPGVAFQLPHLLRQLRTIGQTGTRGVATDAMVNIPAARRQTQPINLTEFTSNPNGDPFLQRWKPSLKTLVVLRGAEDLAVSLGSAWVRPHAPLERTQKQ